MHKRLESKGVPFKEHTTTLDVFSKGNPFRKMHTHTRHVDQEIFGSVEKLKHSSKFFSKIAVCLIRLSFRRSIEWCYSYRSTMSSKKVPCETSKNYVRPFFLTGRYLPIDFTYMMINSTCA